jgi:hypothetical protein
MGGLFSPKMPKPLPPPARPVTAVTKTPDLELADTELVSSAQERRRRGRRGLRTELIDQMSAQTGSTGAGLQIPRVGE